MDCCTASYSNFSILVKAPFAVVFAAMYVGEDYLKIFLCIKHFISRKWLKPVTDEGKQGLEEYMKTIKTKALKG